MKGKMGLALQPVWGTNLMNGKIELAGCLGYQSNERPNGVSLAACL